jgi:hypothetical protein
VTQGTGDDHLNALPYRAVESLEELGHPWISRVRAGIDLYIIAQFMMLVIPALALATELRMEELETLYRFLYRHEIIKIMVTIGVSWLGVWLITTPAPIPDNDRFAAQSLRFVVSFLGIGSIIETIGTDPYSTSAGLSIAAMALLMIAFDFLSFHFIQQDLAPRTQRPDLARQAKLLKWIYPSANFVLPAISPTLRLVSGIARVPLTSQLFAARIFVNIAWVALSVWVILFLFGLRKPFRVASSETAPAPTAPIQGEAKRRE